MGPRLREARKARKMTLVELATICEVDAATISRIETGKMTGTLACHMKIAKGLGVRLAELYHGLEEERAKQGISAQRPASRTEVYKHEAGRSSMSMLTADVLHKKLMPTLVTIEPAGRTHEEEARPGTERFVYVLEGSIEAVIGDQTHLLRRGSTLYFDASIRHELRNTAARLARCLVVTTPPVL